MKPENKKLDFSKSSIVELNDQDMLGVDSAWSLTIKISPVEISLHF